MVAERPDRDLRNEPAVEEIWRSPSRGYVVEHTRVEAFEGQIQDAKAFMRFVGSLQDALSGHLPGRFAVAIPWGVASTSGIRFAEARTEVERLIKNNAEILRDGEAVELTSEQLPFSLRLLKRNSKDSLVFFSRWIEEEKTKLSANDDGSIQGARVDRIGRALDAKIPKLIATADTCKLPSVLILESNDIALSNVFEVAQAFKAAIQGRNEVPDCCRSLKTDQEDAVLLTEN